MDHACADEFPPLLGLFDDLADSLFGHSRIVLQRHPLHDLALVHVPHDADKGRHRTDIRVIGTHVPDDFFHIKRRRLDDDRIGEGGDGDS